MVSTGGGADDANLLQADTAEAEWMEQASQMSGFGGRITVKHVPYIVFTSDLVIAAASGMTIKYVTHQSLLLLLLLV